VKYRDFIAILREQKFTEKRVTDKHYQWEGYVDGKRHMVTVAYSHAGEDIMPRNLASMRRQSGLPKKLFR